MTDRESTPAEDEQNGGGDGPPGDASASDRATDAEDAIERLFGSLPHLRVSRLPGDSDRPTGARGRD